MQNTQSKNKKYDVVVIGAGPAGYVAAIRCAQLGLTAACVDNWLDEKQQHRLGGTCLNVGCVPSKALLDSSQHYYQLNNEFAQHGIRANHITLDVAQMMARKNKIINQLTAGIATLFKANGIDLYTGIGQLREANQVAVTALAKTADSKKCKSYLLEAQHVILATGSKALNIPVACVDNDKIVDSTGALNFSQVPARLAIIGAGVIGLELGSVWNRLGSKVILLEAQEEFLPMADRLIASEALRHFTQQGLDIRIGARVTSTHIGKKQVSVNYQDKTEQKHIRVDRVLVAVGRTPYTEDLFSADINLLLDEAGFVDVDKCCRTNLPNVYAIGDIVRGPMLAHKGSEQGMAVAELIAQSKSQSLTGTVLNSNDNGKDQILPSVVYTEPEIAWAGKTERLLLKEEIPFKSGIFPFAANGRAKAMNADIGQVKILSHAQTDQILGVHIIGPMASELLQQVVVAMEFEGSAEDLARTIFAHPTLSESIHEAALAVDNRAIHAVNRHG